jgi:endogenous inhibitor of DNA gyrase (YacG/DUF329 family)
MVWDTKNKFRPFCSERCKLIDLGAWADGSYSIPTTTPLNDEEQDFNPPDDPEDPRESD